MLRTFLGHGKAVRDISFNNDGSKFLSCSYDRYIKLWDTETGGYIKLIGYQKLTIFNIILWHLYTSPEIF